jgi:UDP-arabinose 4-epimerase
LKNVLVTGGAGYIGSHICKMLAGNGYNPVVFDNFSTGHEWAVKWGPLFRGDLLSETDLEAAFEAHQYCGVIHMAASSLVGESCIMPLDYYRNNFVGTQNLLRVMLNHKVQKIVFSSTCAVYGEPEVVPITEAEALTPCNPYGESKFFIERMMRSCDTAHGLKSVALRYFNASGADPDGEIGEVHANETHLVPIVLDVASGLRSKLTIFGADYETPDSTCIRDYVHVNDLATAHLKALEYLLDEGQTTTLNLANGNGFSVLDVVKVAEKVTGKTIKLESGERRPGDPPILIGQPSLAKKTLGWTAKYLELEDHIQHAWNWYQKNKSHPEP